MFNHILQGVDSSEHALHAARIATDLAREMKSQIFRIVVAFDAVLPYLGEPNMRAAISARMKEAENILQKAQEAVGAIPGELHTRIL